MVMMIERSDGGDIEIWGTWEDLLLAFAVCRHGNKDWDSVAKEVRGRTRAPQATVTPQDCKNRYYGLRRRFEGVVDDEIEGGEQEIGASEIPWMEELRQLRVAELRREVERYDVSIVSLQTKLKSLTEEDDRTADEGRPDLDETKEKSCEETPVTHPENAGDLASGNRPGGGSCDESNSPREYRTPGDEGGRVEPEEEPAEKPDLVAGGEEKGPGEGSCNGSSDSIAKVRNMAEGEGEAKACGAPPESMAESMAESKEAAKESSDVQSSASLSKKRRGRRRKAAVSGASSGGDSAGADDVYPLSRRENKSRPLVGFLGMVRSNKHGSVFERRLEIQESTRYRSMIRQHMDLDIIRSKLEGGAPPYTTTKFFRDLLLLCNNAIVFFSKDSSEHIAATHLRALVNKEIAATKTNKKPTISPPPSESFMAPPPQPLARPKPKSESDTENSAPEKRSSTTVPLLACRKRSSISAKAAAAKKEKPLDLEKELEHVEKKKREVPVARGLRTTKARAAIKKNTSIDNPNPKPDPGDDSTADPAKLIMMVAEKKNNSGGNASVDPLASTAKKRSAAGFLDRLKKSTFSSSSNSAPSLQTLKNSGSGGGGRGGSSEQKKGGKGDGKKEQGSARQIGNKQAQEQSAPVKRSVGRPPKRPPPAKRAREAERDTSPPPPPSRGSNRKRGKR